MIDLDIFDSERKRHKPSYRYAGRPRSSRRRHPHIFSWVVLAGGALLLGIAGMAIASSLGLWGALTDAYFAVTKAILPASWQDEWLALPGIAHVALVLGALFVVVGMLGEVFD